jgi:hypothetical protein
LKKSAKLRIHIYAPVSVQINAKLRLDSENENFFGIVQKTAGTTKTHIHADFFDRVGTNGLSNAIFDKPSSKQKKRINYAKRIKSNQLLNFLS